MPAGPCRLNLTIKANSARNAPAKTSSLRKEFGPAIVGTSAHVADVQLQLFERVAVAGECPRSVRVLENAEHGS